MEQCESWRDAPNGRISPRRAAGQHCSVAVGQHGSSISMAGRQHSSSAGSGPALQLEIRPMAVSLWQAMGQHGRSAAGQHGNAAGWQYCSAVAERVAGQQDSAVAGRRGNTAAPLSGLMTRRISTSAWEQGSMPAWAAAGQHGSGAVGQQGSRAACRATGQHSSGAARRHARVPLTLPPPTFFPPVAPFPGTIISAPLRSESGVSNYLSCVSPV